MESLDDDDGYGFEFRFHNIKNSLHKELKPKKAFYQVPKIMTTYFILYLTFHNFLLISSSSC